MSRSAAGHAGAPNSNTIAAGGLASFGRAPQVSHRILQLPLFLGAELLERRPSLGVGGACTSRRDKVQAADLQRQATHCRRQRQEGKQRLHLPHPWTCAALQQHPQLGLRMDPTKLRTRPTCHAPGPSQHLSQQRLRRLLPPELLLRFGQVEQRAHVLRRTESDGSDMDYSTLARLQHVAPQLHTGFAAGSARCYQPQTPHQLPRVPHQQLLYRLSHPPARRAPTPDLGQASGLCS